MKRWYTKKEKLQDKQLMEFIKTVHRFKPVRRGRPRKGEETLKDYVCIKVYQPLYGSLDRLSRQQGRDMTDIAREAIMVYLMQFVTIEEMVKIAMETGTAEETEPTEERQDESDGITEESEEE